MLYSLSIYSQVDTIIKTKYYTSYYSFLTKNPVFVSYKLYQGGGSCKREGLNFKSAKSNKIATNKDYSDSGYDKGHLANAEDFAYDCEALELTFNYINCIPQTPDLNRGMWKVYEKKIRDLSQTDSLLIISGGVSGKRFMKDSKVAIPRFCFKIVQSLTTKKILYCVIFSNKKNNSKSSKSTMKFLEQSIKYKIPLKK